MCALSCTRRRLFMWFIKAFTGALGGTFAANDTLQQYDRGVAWSTENLDVKGQQWQSVYLTVWLYSYQ